MTLAKLSESIATSRAVALALMIVSSISCADIDDSITKFEFRALYWPAALVIEQQSTGDVTWSAGIDQGGRGQMCGPTSEFECLELEGLWVFAIPKKVLQKPSIGDIWSYGNTKFLLEEIVFLSQSFGNCPTLVITAEGGTSETMVFHYNPTFGISHISHLFDDQVEFDLEDGSPLERVAMSVWRRVSMPEAKSCF